MVASMGQANCTRRGVTSTLCAGTMVDGFKCLGVYSLRSCSCNKSIAIPATVHSCADRYIFDA